MGHGLADSRDVIGAGHPPTHLVSLDSYCQCPDARRRGDATTRDLMAIELF
jgi:hypothetical protein